MKRGLVIGFLLFIGLARPSSVQQAYKPPEVASAGDVYVPYQVVLDGLFVLDVSLDDDGKIQEIDGLRDPGSMLDAAKRSVSQWKFQPASVESKSAPSRMTVIFVYCPSNYGIGGPVPPKHFSPVLPPNRSEPSDRGNYLPVGVLSFAYPEYPVNSVAWGSVVVQLTVDSSGEMKGVDFLHGMEIFNSFVSDALKKWRFQAATFNGKPIKSKTVIAFAFQPPPSSSRAWDERANAWALVAAEQCVISAPVLPRSRYQIPCSNAGGRYGAQGLESADRSGGDRSPVARGHPG